MMKEVRREGAKMKTLNHLDCIHLTTRSVMKAQSFCGGGGAVWLHVECVVFLGEADGETFQQDVNCTIMVMCG